MKRTSQSVVISAAALFMLCTASAHGQEWKDEEVPIRRSYIPAKGYVPDEAAASAIAEAVLVPIYGKDAIDNQKPFLVTLDNDVWIVLGQRKKDPKRLILGGVFRIEISKQDARVRSHTHGK